MRIHDKARQQSNHPKIEEDIAAGESEAIQRLRAYLEQQLGIE